MFRKELVREEILEVLMFLGGKVGIEFTPLKLSTAWELSFKEWNTDKTNKLKELISMLGERLNLPLLFFEGTFADALAFQVNTIPIVTQIEHKGHIFWVNVLRKVGPYIQFESINTPGRKFWIREKKLENLFWMSIFYPNTFSGEIYSEKEHPSPYDRLKRLIRLESEDVIVVTIYSAVIVLLYLVVPVGIQSLINILSFGTLYQPIVVLSMLVTLAMGFAGVLKLLQSYIGEVLQQRFFARLVTELSIKLPYQDYEKLEKAKPEEKVNYFLDITIVQKSATTLLVDGFVVILQTFVGFFVLVYYHSFFLILGIVLTLLISLILFGELGKKAIHTSIQESYSKHKLASWFQEVAGQKYTFRNDDSFQYANLKAESYGQSYIKNRKDHFDILIRQISMLIVVQTLSMGLVLGVGGFLVIKGEMTLGQLVAAEIILSKILESFSKSGKYIESYYDLSASLDKIGHLLDVPLEKTGIENVNFENSNFEIKIKNIQIPFSKKKNIIIPFEWNLIEGKKYGILSDCTSGDFIIDTLYGLRKYENGIIEFGKGYAIQNIHLSYLRNYIKILKDSNLVSGTIVEYFLMQKLSTSKDEIRDSLEMVGISEKLNHLPEGIHTVLSSNGYPLKKEDKLLIKLASILTAKPKLLLVNHIWDELSLNLREVFVKNYSNDSLNKSIVMTTSSYLQNLEFCDEIYVLQKDGKLIEYNNTKGIV
jgi:putative ABC transport system ATP-binding protein